MSPLAVSYLLSQVALCREPSTVAHGNNSGYAAINLAWHLGASEIVLLGYDMRPGEVLGQDRNGNNVHQIHWHDNHPVPTRPTVFEKMKGYFPPLAQELENEGVKVWNATPGSALECFERISLRYLV